MSGGGQEGATIDTSSHKSIEQHQVVLLAVQNTNIIALKRQQHGMVTSIIILLTNIYKLKYRFSMAWMKSLNSLKGVPFPHRPKRVM